MIKKWDRKTVLTLLYSFVALALAVTVCFLLVSKFSHKEQPKQASSSTSVSTSKSDSSEQKVSISGEYVANTGDKAKIDGGNKEWKINYQTPDGAVSAEFTTEWKSEGETLIATDKMRKSDGNSDFTITVRIFKYKTAKQPLITITMSDGNPAHEMVFANQKDFFEPSDENGEGTSISDNGDLNIESIMKGDYTTLAGVWKNGAGREIVISSDGKVNDTELISPNSHSSSQFPTLNVRSGNTGYLIALLKIGFTNPYGDLSDSSKARLALGQNIGNLPADQYYYRQ